MMKYLLESQVPVQVPSTTTLLTTDSAHQQHASTGISVVCKTIRRHSTNSLSRSETFW